MSGDRWAAAVRVRKLEALARDSATEEEACRAEAARLRRGWRLTDREVADSLAPEAASFPVGGETEETPFAASLLGAMGWALGWTEEDGPVALGRDLPEAALAAGAYTRIAAGLRRAFAEAEKEEAALLTGGGTVMPSGIVVYMGFSSMVRAAPWRRAEPLDRPSFYHGVVRGTLEALASGRFGFPRERGTALALRPPDPVVGEGPEGATGPFRRVVVRCRRSAEEGERQAWRLAHRPW